MRHLRLLILLSFLPATAFPQQMIYSAGAEEEFAAGLTFYSEGEFDSAAVVFHRLGIGAAHHRQSAALVMAAKSYLQTGDFAHSALEVDRFRSLFPSSRFTADAFFTRAAAKAAAGLVLSAVADCDSLFRFSPPPALRSAADSLAWFLGSRKEVVASADSLLNALRGVSLRSIIALRASEVLMKDGEIRRARWAMEHARAADLPKWLAAEHSRTAAELSGAHVCTVGVLLPFSSVDRFTIGAAREILEGARLAVELLREPGGTFVHFEIKDTRRDPDRALRELRSLAGDPDVLFALGPMYSDQVLGFGAAHLGLPLLSPTANEAGIVHGGGDVFLMNPDDSVKVAAIAQFAAKVMHDSLIAVVLPSVGSQRLAVRAMRRANAFEKSLAEARGRVTSTQRFDPSSGDLSSILKPLRVALRAKKVQAVYAPLEGREEIEVLLSQLAYFDVKTQLYGSDEWNDISALLLQKGYSSGVVFPTDTYPRDSTELTQVRGLYESKTHRAFSRFVLYGYDAMKVGLSVLKASGGVRKEFARALRTLPPVKGVHNDIFFGGTQVNQAVPVLQFTGEDVIRRGTWIVGRSDGTEAWR
ncbi:MAG: hypothetical protein COS95_04175 [Ignavibacteriales bacterium CG07_land_8_20_14_0_80_59_12]|nr:MAG: hypothetical protein COS95_04175 [Ignavibacteriales bacterium CG07_land_8_20_14_0_80_59_12]